MAKRAERKDTLRERILAAAEARIRSEGVGALRARDVMADAGAALGGLYNAFADLDDVVLHVNSRTLARLSAALGACVADGRDPADALRALALGYLAFARDNRPLWQALFEYRYASGRPMPDWHLAEQAELLVHVVEPLRGLRSDWKDEALLLRARTLFGAIHGIVSISVEERFVGISAEGLRDEIGRFVDLLVTGMRSGI